MQSDHSSVLQTAHSRKQNWADTLIQAVFVAIIALSILAYCLPVFSTDLYIPQRTYDFGTVKAGTVVRKKFSVRNLHLWPVTVLSVAGSCGCTNAVVGQTLPFQLAPLQSFKVEMTLTTSNAGHIEEEIVVVTKDNKGIPLTVRGEVQ